MKTMIKALTFTLALVFYPIAFAEDSNDDVIAKAPVLLVILDNSGSSPATMPQVVNSGWNVIENKIRAMPLASQVTVFTVGDASAPYFSKTIRIQQKTNEQGGTVDDVVEQVKSMVLSFPEQVKSGSIPAHGRSELIGGFFDSSNLLNEKADNNSIIIISDLVENSDIANCYKPKGCHLPAPTFSLKGTDITVLGAGFGLPSELAMPISKSWTDFLKKAGATSVKLERVI